MASALLVQSGTPVATVAGATDFWCAGSANVSKDSTETNRQVVFRAAGVLKKLYVRTNQNSTTATSSVKVRKNAGNGNQTVTIALGTAGVNEDTVNVDTIVPGDKMAIQSITGTGGTITVAVLSNTFDANPGNTVSILVNDAATAFASASVSRYNPLCGSMSSAVGVEGSATTRIRKAGTLKNLHLFIASGANARAENTTVTSRINSGAGGMSITIGSSATGIFEDTNNIDTLTAGQDSDYSVATLTSTNTLTMQLMKSEFQTTTDNGLDCAGAPGAYAPATAVTSSFALSGNLIVGATEADRKTKARVAFTLSELTVSVTANTLTATSNFRSRKNGANGTMLVAYGSGAIGTVSDSVNVDVCAVSDDLNTQVITGSTGTAITIRNIVISTQRAGIVQTVYVEWEEA